MSVEITDKWKFTKAIIAVLAAMFFLGIALGSCSLGIKLPVAVFELVTGQSVAR